MEPLFLAQLIGCYLLVVGVIVALRRTSIMPAVSELVKSKALLIIIACVELAAGLAIVLTYPQITFDWMGIIALVGWMMVVEGVLYLALPSRRVQKMVRVFNTPTWYVIGGVLAALLGLYLASVGFGLL